MVLFYAVELQMTRLKLDHLLLRRYGHKDQLISKNIRMNKQADRSTRRSLQFREGTMKIGDRVLAINGINVGGATLQDAYNLMKQCRGTTLFLIEYDVAIVGRMSSKG